ncbi:Bicyclomycin resistance protein [Sulfitobacter sp. DSM 110093]|uniref:Bcr/CflA family efflux MFS transporter n=1 Tax=Sulfitobacter sp. DSM 110093 TaxID=2883127 RepID=UPI001FAE3919|nr:Bcr/CflA family efflux MFS transporter [Sulfitobacter sp. DSM 110093]UOA32790.1 Bicyclomycin resistance protein [Sulfitobacter sp. DSM 110093]
MKVEQPALGRKGILFFLIVLGAFPPLTMDLYLPALPKMAEIFSTSTAMVNLTLGAYMVAFAVGMLFWGPLSERTGRKPILFAALGLYIPGSLLCAFAFNIEALIAFRVLQGFGGGGVTVIGTTIVKDLFDGRDREKALAIIMSLVIVAPMVAPVLGAFLLKIASWQILFIVLAGFGCVAASLVILYRETLEEKSTDPVLKTWNRLGAVLANSRFAYLLLIFSMAPMCLMAFIGIAAYVYIDGFGMSEQGFSFIFAFNAICAAFGPVLYLRLARVIPVQSIVLGSFVVVVLAGIAMLLVGGLSPWLFAALVAPTTVAVITVRVPGANLMLDQQSRDTGSAAALIQFSVTMMGAVGIQVVSMNSQNLIWTYGLLLAFVGTTCAVLWMMVDTGNSSPTPQPFLLSPIKMSSRLLERVTLEAKSNRIKDNRMLTLLRTLPLTVLVLSSAANAQSAAEVARYDQLVARFQTATVVGLPEIADCTLSGGTQTSCLKITVVAAPSDHITGPFCPRTITDTAEDGGKWFVDGKVRDVDGAFIVNLAKIYGDDAWQMFDPETGEVYVRAGEIGCIVAGDPTNETGQPDNICVECELGYVGHTVTQTYFIPLTPVPVAQSDDRIGASTGIGLAFNGVKFYAPAPLDLILGGHTLGPFDDCTGHINPHTGYHYHGVTEGCGARVAAVVVGHADMIGVAMDGFDIYDRLDADGIEPDDLDTCRGHEVEGLGYHYHVNPTAENQVIGCFAAETGCSSGDAEATCDASTQQRPPRP